MPKRECIQCRALFEPVSGESRCPDHQQAQRRRRDSGRRSPAYVALAYAIKHSWITCAFDGCTDRASEVDHIIPLANGGDESAANLRPACMPHNRAKGKRLDSNDADQVDNTNDWFGWVE